jgi:hypothetical protein
MSEHHDKGDAPLHRPLDAQHETFKAGLAIPGGVPPKSPAPQYGWICAKCGCGNAPTMPVCQRCSKEYS